VTGDELLAFIASGDIEVQPNVQHIDGPEVIFENGWRARPTSIVFCTGYAREFPFMRDLVTVAADSSIALYKHVFPPDLPSIAFVGMCRVQGSVFPIVELQARWVARVLAGKTLLPSRERMQADIKARRRRALPDESGTYKLGIAPMRVGFLEYADEIAREIGAQPHLWRHPRLLGQLLVGPVSAAQFRLDGPARLPSGVTRHPEGC
jgi:dimethylaniline monooxygenase (N-oxide forming)